MTALQCLALAALRRWCWERGALRRGTSVPPFVRPGRPSNDPADGTRRREAGIIRCIDFERAFDTLPAPQQALLLAVYREGLGDRVAAELIGKSQRYVAYAKIAALDALADVLDRRSLL
ncbi:MAG: hypothetical protein P4L40_01065 [Terracidiphilus sp.]|nr:hypothetical protein [Terracidiphilus sp.]